MERVDLGLCFPLYRGHVYNVLLKLKLGVIVMSDSGIVTLIMQYVIIMYVFYDVSEATPIACERWISQGYAIQYTYESI